MESKGDKGILLGGWGVLILGPGLVLGSPRIWGQEEESSMQTVLSLPTTGRNSFYISNREPLLPSPLIPSSYVGLDRTWREGDQVRLELPMALALTVWEKNHQAVSGPRGPLTYSLQIRERWEQYGGTDEWPAFEVFPTKPWNYGLRVDLNHPAASFEGVKPPGPLAEQPFTVDQAPIHLRAQGKRGPQWKMEQGLVGDLWQPVAGATEYGIQPDRFNRVTFDPVETTSLRLEV